MKKIKNFIKRIFNIERDIPKKLKRGNINRNAISYINNQEKIYLKKKIKEEEAEKRRKKKKKYFFF